jgi:hypothetical protein
MAELALVDYFVMGEAIGIVATLFVIFYFSRKQMQTLSIDIETKVLSDLDDKINDLTRLAVEKPKLMRIVSDVESDLTEEVAYTYHLLFTFAHAYHMHQRKVVSDNEWTGWLRRIRSCFEEGKIREYWESDLDASFYERFYSHMTKGTFMGMTRATSEKFQFSIKVPETITHIKRMDINNARGWTLIMPDTLYLDN